MNLKSSAIVLASTLISTICFSQTGTAPLEDFKPSTLNQPGQQYPQVNSQGYARFRIVAPYADSVRVSLGLGGTRGGTPLKKVSDSVWMGGIGDSGLLELVIQALPLSDLESFTKPLVVGAEAE